MRVGLDTNLLVYAACVESGPHDKAKIAAAPSILDRLASGTDVVIPAQVLGELFSVLVRSGRTRDLARDKVLAIAEGVAVAATSPTTSISALDLAVEHRLQIWDAIVLTAAAEAGCAFLLSEDMQHGFTWRGVTILNPFLDPMDERLAALLAG